MSDRVLFAEAIIFDLDGVLANSISVVEKAWSIWAAEHGRDPEPIVKIVHGRRNPEIFQMIAPELDVRVEAARLVAIEQDCVDDVTPIPGALEFVRSLPRERWAIGTSGERAVALGRLHKLGFPIPDILISSEDVEFGKPDPAVYLSAAAGINIPPESCIVFEDAPPGIEAAIAAGMTPVGLLTTYPASELQAATALIGDFRRVTATVTPAGIEVRIRG